LAAFCLWNIANLYIKHVSCVEVAIIIMLYSKSITAYKAFQYILHTHTRERVYINTFMLYIVYISKRTWLWTPKFWEIQSNLYLNITFGTKKKWPNKTGGLSKEVQFIWNCLWQNSKKVTFQYRWLLDRGDRMGRFDCS